MRISNGRMTKQMLGEWVTQFKFHKDGPCLTHSCHLCVCKSLWHMTGAQCRCPQVWSAARLEGSGNQRLGPVLVTCQEGKRQLRESSEGCTSVLQLFHHFAVGVFYLLRVSDIHLEHREALGACSSQFLCSWSLFIQNSHKYREAKLIQVFGQSVAKSRIATCKELR